MKLTTFLFCILMLSFSAHAAEFGAEVPEEPIFFTKYSVRNRRDVVACRILALKRPSQAVGRIASRRSE